MVEFFIPKGAKSPGTFFYGFYIQNLVHFNILINIYKALHLERDCSKIRCEYFANLFRCIKINRQTDKSINFINTQIIKISRSSHLRCFKSILHTLCRLRRQQHQWLRQNQIDFERTNSKHESLLRRI